jgi:hypothetical protein
MMLPEPSGPRLLGASRQVRDLIDVDLKSSEIDNDEK